MRRNPRLARITSLTIGFLSCQPALAAYWCDGQVSSVGLDQGSVYVQYGAYGIQSICSLNPSSNAIQPEGCRAWYAMLMSAHAQQRAVRIYYEESTSGNAPSCNALQQWGSYKPYFMQIL
jgi:hypothetical protein